jgi:transcription elongation factor GreB
VSKAFTKEAETEVDFEGEIPALPAGTKNYITPEGLQRLQDEFAQLQKIERPKTLETVSWAAGNGDRSENGDYIYGKRRLREIDGRMRFLRKEWKSPKPSIPRGNRIESGSISARRSFIVRGVKKGRLGS